MHITLGVFDYFFIISYIAATLVFALYKFEKSTGLKSHIVGERKYSTLTMIATTCVTMIGGNSILGVIEQTYKFGYIFLFACIADALSNILVGKFIAGKVRSVANIITVGDLMCHKYGNNAKIITGIIGCILSLCVLSLQIAILSNLFVYLCGINQFLSLLFTCAIVILYSILGGINAIIRSNVLQFFVILLVLPNVVHYAIRIFDDIPEIVLWYDTSYDYIPFLIFLSIPSLKPSIVNRFLMAKTPVQAENSMMVAGLIKLIFYILVGILAIVATVYVPGVNPKEAFFLLVDNFFATPTKGFIIVVLIAAIISTADIELNSAISCIVYDAMIPLSSEKFTEKFWLYISKLLILIFSICSAFIVLYSESLMKIMYFGKDIWVPITLIPLLLLLFVNNIKEKFYIANAIVMLGLYILWVSFDLRIKTGFEFVVPAIPFSAFMCLFYLTYQKNSVNQNITSFMRAVLKRYRLSRLYSIFLNITSRLSGLSVEICFFSAYNIAFYVLAFLFVREKSLYVTCIKNIGTLSSFISLIDLYIWKYGKIMCYLRFLCVLCNMIILPFILVFITGFDPIMLVHMTLCLVVFVMLLDGYITISTTSIFFAVLFLILYKKMNISQYFLKAPMYFCMFISGIAFIFIRNIYSKQREKLAVAKITGSMIAHEIRTPLATIAINFKLLQRFIRNTNAKNIIETGLLATMRANNTINSFLICCRDNYNVQLEAIKLSTLLSQALCEYGMLETEKSKITVNDDAKAVEIITDVFLTKHVIFNILKNAFFLISQNKRGDIMITIQNNILIIADNIIGMKAGMTEKIWDCNANSIHLNGSSFGFGLPFCKFAIEKIGGSIICESEYLKYTRFIITFPMKSEA